MNKILIYLTLIAGLTLTPLIYAGDTDIPKSKAETKGNMVMLTLKTKEGDSIRVYVHKKDVAKAKKLKKGDKLELIWLPPIPRHFPF